jgi:biopolymer transport protein ExbD
MLVFLGVSFPSIGRPGAAVKDLNPAGGKELRPAHYRKYLQNKRLRDGTLVVGWLPSFRNPSNCCYDNSCRDHAPSLAGVRVSLQDEEASMQKKLLLIGLSLALVICALIAILGTRRRKAELPQVVAESQFQTVDADSALCEADEAQLRQRTIVVQLISRKHGEQPMAQINMDDLNLKTAYARLTDIYKTRNTKTLFLRISPEVDQQFRSELMGIVRSAGIQRVCLLDFSKDPHWFQGLKRTGPGA